MKKIAILSMAILFVFAITGYSGQSSLPFEEVEALHQIALYSQEPGLRVGAIRALGRIGNKKSIEILTKIMGEAIRIVNPDPQFHARMEKARVEALKAIRRFNLDAQTAGQVTPEMIKVMRADPAEIVQSEAALSLGVVGSKTVGQDRVKVVDDMVYKLNRCPNTKNLLAFMLCKGFAALQERTAKVATCLLGAYKRGYLLIVRTQAKMTLKQLFPGKYDSLQ